MANAGYILMGGRRGGKSRPPVRSMTVREYHNKILAERPETAAMERSAQRSTDDRAREAIDVMTRDMVNDARNAGKEVSENAIRTEVTKIAETCENKRSSGDI